MIEINYQGHSNRKQKALKKWYAVLADYKNGISADAIAKKHNRTRSWVYWVLRKFKNNEI